MHITRKHYNGSNSKVGDIVLRRGVPGIVIFRTTTEFVVDYWEDKRLVVYPRNGQTELLMGSMEEVMEGKVETGSPAFPCYPETLPQKDQDFAGMPLRDYFAAKALPSCYAEYCAHANVQGYSEDWRMGVALDSYVMADAMLRARGVGCRQVTAHADETAPRKDGGSDETED